MIGTGRAPQSARGESPRTSDQSSAMPASWTIEHRMMQASAKPSAVRDNRIPIPSLMNAFRSRLWYQKGLDRPFWNGSTQSKSNSSTTASPRPGIRQAASRVLAVRATLLDGADLLSNRDHRIAEAIELLL